MAKNFNTNIVMGGKINPSLASTFNIASKMSEKYGSKIGGIAKNASKVAKGIAVSAGAATVAVGVAAAKFASNFLENTDSLEKMRAQTGLSYDSLQKFQYIGGQLSVSMDSISNAAMFMNKSMGAAKDGSNDAAAAYGALGVKFKDVTTGALRPQSAVFNESLTALANMKNASERNALAYKIFGKGAKDLIPLFDAGGTQIKNLAQEAVNLGLVMSDDAVSAGDQFGDTLEKLKNVAQGAGSKLISGFIPTLQKVADKLLLNSPQIIENITNVAQKISKFIGGAFDKARPVIDWMINVGLPIAYNVLLKVKDGAFAVADFITKNWEGIKPVILGIVAAMTAWKAITLGMAIYQGIMAAIRAGTIAAALAQWGLNAAVLANPMTWIVVGVAAAIGVLVAGIYLLWKNWDKVSTFMVGLWQNNVLPFFQGVGTFFTGIWNGITDGFKGVINWIVDKLNFVIGTVNKVTGAIGGVIGVKVQIPLIPKFARGGIATKPSIFGEAGPEIAIPLKRTPRSLGLLNQASKLIKGESGNVIHITYAPQVTGTNKSEISQALQANYELFKAWLEQYFQDKEAVSFG